MLVAMIAGILDWRSRRIPNWLTVSGLVAGIAVNAGLAGWGGIKVALLGALLGLALLFPLVLVRSMGAGDWKLAGALGAALGARQLGTVLVVAFLLAGLIALIVVLWSGRLKQTLLNVARMLGALLSLRMPPAELSIDDPGSTKIPFGVAMSAAVLLIGLGRILGKV